MNLNEIKKEALEFKGQTMQMLSVKVSELKVKGVGFFRLCRICTNQPTIITFWSTGNDS